MTTPSSPRVAAETQVMVLGGGPAGFAAALASARLGAATTARQYAEQQYSSEQRQFQAGTSTVFLVLQRQTDMINARNRETRAHADFAESLANLDRATARTIESRGIRLQ